MQFKTLKSHTFNIATGLLLLLVSIQFKQLILSSTHNHAYVFFYPTLVIAFYFFEVLCALTFLLFSVLAIDYLYIQPYHDLTMSHSSLLVLMLYIISASAIGYLILRLKKTNRRLELSEKTYRAAFTHAPTGILRINANTFRIIDANPFALHMFGYSLADIQKRTIFELTHEDYAQETRETKYQLANGAIHFAKVEKKYLKADNTDFWAQLTATVEHDQHETVTTIIENIIDISDKKRIEDTLKSQAIQDELTQLFNRRYLDERIVSEIRNSKLNNYEVTLLYFDVDYFKKINDIHGHPTGDLVLKKLAQTCKEQLRASDILGRYGGEEFIALLPRTDLEKGLEIAERLRTNTERLKLMTDKSDLVTFTISIGVTKIYSDDAFKQVVRRADIALYNAKGQGRNRIVVEL